MRLGVVAMSTAVATALEAKCFCGAVTVRVAPGSIPQASSICHCHTCRSLSGAPFLANLIFSAEDIELISTADGGCPNLVSMSTSKAVTRSRCASCYSPVSATLGSKRLVVPAALFERDALPADWAVQHHLYYGSRIMNVEDSLPKFLGHFGGPSWVADEPTES